VDTTLNIPDGGTALLSGWTKVSEGRNECGPPVLSKVPYANRLFKNVAYGRETQQVVVLVTPRVIVSEEKEPEKLPPPREVGTPCPKPAPAATAGSTEEQEPTAHPEATARERKVALLLKKYQQACAAGDLPRAKKYAVRALILDPACFRKDRPAAGR
jgi:type II secretory pathway component GspD/PulD (secretin)